MESRKEYFAAVSGEVPSKSANEIVDPDLEIPGIIAIPWTKPISGVSEGILVLIKLTKS